MMLSVLDKKSAASPDMATRSAERAAVLADQRLVRALRTLLASKRAALARGLSFGPRHIENAHARERIARFGENSEHRIGVDDQLSQIGDGGRPRLRLLGPRNAGQERATALGVTEKLA